MKPCPMKLAALIALCGLITACTQTPTMTLEAAPADLFDPAVPLEVTGSEGVGARHGNIIAMGVGEGLLKGAGVGAYGSVYGGAQTGHPAGLALGIALAPFVAVGGAIYGATLAHSSEETEQAITAIVQIYDDKMLLGSLDEMVGQRIQKLEFPAQKPCASVEGYSETGAEASVNAPAECDAAAPKNQLHLTVSYGFFTDGEYSPDLQYSIDVTAIATTSDRNRTAEKFRWTYFSPELDFFDETNSEAASLRRHIAAALEQLADRIIDDLLVERHSSIITRASYPDSKGTKFAPQSLTLGAVTRLPTQS